MARISLKRPFEMDVPSNLHADNNWPTTCASANSSAPNFLSTSTTTSNSQQTYGSPSSNFINQLKRRCSHSNQTSNNFQNNTPISLFKSPVSLLNPLSDQVAASIKDEALKTTQYRNEAPVMFTIAQTQTICEKIIKDREQRLREEYDRILQKQLAEQYEIFVKYTQDNISRLHNNSSAHLSYLS